MQTTPKLHGGERNDLFELARKDICIEQWLVHFVTLSCKLIFASIVLQMMDIFYIIMIMAVSHNAGIWTD